MATSAAETRRAAPAKPPLKRAVVSAIFPRCPHEKNAGDDQRHAKQYEQKNTGNRIHDFSMPAPAMFLAPDQADPPPQAQSALCDNGNGDIANESGPPDHRSTLDAHTGRPPT